jgi:RNA polymerase sigma-70 factor (ECF subfamily)
MDISCQYCRDEALQSIWTNMHDRLLAFVLTRIDSLDEAEDILQDVFLKVHLNLSTIRDVSKIESWIFQITRNSISDRYRKTGNIRLDEDVPIHDSYAINDPTDEIATYVREIVDTLSPIYREAIELIDYQGMNQFEAAKNIGISVSGMKSRIQRARAMVREIMLACCHFGFDTEGIHMEYYNPRCRCDEKSVN